MPFKDLSHRQFGRLTALTPILKYRGSKRTAWKCRCECGNYAIVRSDSLKVTKSCGCLHSETTSKMLTVRNIKHGLTDHPLFAVWTQIKQRCTNPRNHAYANYGSRGIYMCNEWLDNSQVFIEWALSHGWNKGLHIDRIDNNGPYSPDNCRFVKPETNVDNRRKTLYVNYDNKRTPLAYLVRTIGKVPYHKAWRRITKYRWDPIIAITTEDTTTCPGWKK